MFFIWSVRDEGNFNNQFDTRYYIRTFDITIWFCFLNISTMTDEEKKAIATLTTKIFGDSEYELIFTGENVNALEVTRSLAYTIVQIVGKPQLSLKMRNRMIELIIKEVVQGIGSYLDDIEREEFTKKFVSDVINIGDDCNKFLETLKNK